MCWALLALTIANRVSKNYVPFTGQLQPIYFTCNGLKTKPIGFKYKLSKVWRVMLCNPMKPFLNQGCLNQCSFRASLVDSLWLTEHCYNQPRGDCYNLPRHTLRDKKLYISNPVMIQLSFTLARVANILLLSSKHRITWFYNSCGVQHFFYGSPKIYFHDPKKFFVRHFFGVQLVAPQFSMVN